MPDLFAELRNFFLFLEAVFEVLIFTGLGAASLVVFGYEITSKRRI